MPGCAALITGASSGIGAAVALALADRGARITLVGRRSEQLHGVAAEVERRGGQAHVLVSDLAAPRAAEQAVDQAAARWGELNVLVNNAGVGHWDTAATSPDGAWDEELHVNLLAPMLATRAAVPIMCAQASGDIINVSSLAARFPGPGAAGYVSSKAGLTSFSESMHAELRADGVRVTVVETAEVATEMQTAEDQASMPMLSPEEVADAVTWVLDLPRSVVVRTLQLVAGPATT